MTEREMAAGALKETTVFLSHLKDLPDYRQKEKVAYPLEEVLLLLSAAALTGAETVADIARFGRPKLAFLQRFRRFDIAAPSHDELVDLVAFQRCFVAWAAAHTNKILAIPALFELLAIEGAVDHRRMRVASAKSRRQPSTRRPITSSR
jgi:DDE_Tnp_1-associated